MAFDFNLPPAYTKVRLQHLTVAENTQLLPQVFALVRAQYPEWPDEQLQNWLNALAGGNDHGTKMAVSTVLDEQGDVVATSALELYKNGTVMINYSLAKKMPTVMPSQAMPRLFTQQLKTWLRALKNYKPAVRLSTLLVKNTI